MKRIYPLSSCLLSSSSGPSHLRRILGICLSSLVLLQMAVAKSGE